jgi:PAS domain S-box-containing protein
MKIKLAISTILIICLIYIGLYYDNNKKTTRYLAQQTKLFNKIYETNYCSFIEKSKIIFNTIIDKKEIISIYKQLQVANKKQKNILRNELYQLLNDDYKLLKLKQLHFHLTSNESFLRFHKPSKFGDDLTKIRDTINYVNKNSESIDGFEVGKRYGGYRFIYPLKDKNNIHLGSVEILFDISIFTKIFMKYFEVTSNFHIKSSIIDAKILKDVKLNNYKKSPMENFYMTKRIVNQIKENPKLNFNKIIASDDTLKKALKNINANKTISLYDKKTNLIITFIPIKNPITNKVIGFLTIRSDSNYINEINFTFYLLFLSFSLLTLIIIYILHKRFNIQSKRFYTQTKINELFAENERILQNKVKIQTKTIQNNIDIISKNIIYTKTDLDGIITDTSEAYCNISSYTKGELIGKPHNIIRHPDMPTSIFKEIWNTIQNNKVWKGELKNKTKNGGHHWIEVTITPEYNKNGKKIGYIAIKYDITDKKELEKKDLLLFEQAKMVSMGEMIENIAHQWREPLNVISMSIANMKISKELNVLTDEDFTKKKP